MTRKHPQAVCERCPYQARTYVPSEIRSDSKYVVIGESPGRDEANMRDRTGKPVHLPFIGASGQLLWTLMQQAGVTRQQCSVTNAIACQPPEREEDTFVGNRGAYDNAAKQAQKKADDVDAEKEQASMCCLPRLKAELAEAGGDRWLLLGRVAQAALVPGLEGSKNTRMNRWIPLGDKHTLFTWHPAYVLRNPADARTMFQGLSKFLKDPKPGPKLPPPVPFVVLDSPGSLEAMCEVWETTDAVEICIDTETDQIDWQRDPILCMGIYDGGQQAYVVPRAAFDAVLSFNIPWTRALMRFFALDAEWILQNSKYDQRFLVGQYGFDVRCTFDTMLAHGSLDERKGTHDLKGLCAQYFDIEDWELEMANWIGTSRAHNARYSIIPQPNLFKYVSKDVYYTWHLKQVLARQLIAQGAYEWPFKNLLMEINEFLLGCEVYGVRVDRPKLAELLDEYSQRLEDAAREIEDYTDGYVTNPGSTKQVSEFVFDVLKIVRKKRMNKKPRSTDDEVLAQLMVEQEEAGTTESDAYGFYLLLRKYRRIQKMRSSYLMGLWDNMNEEDVYYNDFQPLGAETGRLSSRGVMGGPSLLTFPRPNDRDIGVEGQKVRSLIIPREGHAFINADFSQAELRMACHLSGDQFLKASYEAGRDLHSEVTKQVFGENFTDEQRQRIKVVNFRWLNGGDVKTQLYARGESISQAVADELAERYNRTMAGLVDWGREQNAQMHKLHYVQSMFGRTRHMPLINDKNSEECRKAAINFPIQGASSDITQLAAVKAHREFKRHPEWDAHILMTVHDSIMVECNEAYKDTIKAYLKQVMLDTAAEYVDTVPYKVDVKMGYAWGDM